MKTITFLFLALAFSYQNNTETDSLKIIITDIKTKDGIIEVGIYKDAKSFPNVGKQYKTIRKKVTDNEMTLVINNLEEGEYAIAVYHDKNEDSKCNLNFFGIPTEAYGFSRKNKRIFSKPKFKNCKINTCKTKSIQVKLLH